MIEILSRLNRIAFCRPKSRDGILAQWHHGTKEGVS